MRYRLTFCLVLTLFSCRNKTETSTIKTVNQSISTTKKDTIIPKKTAPFVATKTDEHVPEELPEMEDNFIQRALIDLKDSSIRVYENIRADYRIFGYKAPDTNSKKLILFSVFTNDVKDNPHHCTYGAYYSSGVMQNMKMKYVKRTGNFIEAHLISDTELISPLFIHRRWVQFEQ